MSLKRGNFILECDNCGRTEDLGTTDFEEAKELAKDHKDENNWTTISRGGRFMDVCETCT